MATSCVPSGTRILPMVPSSTASNSMVALSVSISAMTSPALTVSPSFLSHLARLPFSMVGDSAGMRMLMGIGASSASARDGSRAGSVCGRASSRRRTFRRMRVQRLRSSRMHAFLGEARARVAGDCRPGACSRHQRRDQSKAARSKARCDEAAVDAEGSAGPRPALLAAERVAAGSAASCGWRRPFDSPTGT